MTALTRIVIIGRVVNLRVGVGRLRVAVGIFLDNLATLALLAVWKVVASGRDADPDSDPGAAEVSRFGYLWRRSDRRGGGGSGGTFVGVAVDGVVGGVFLGLEETSKSLPMRARSLGVD